MSGADQVAAKSPARVKPGAAEPGAVSSPVTAAAVGGLLFNALVWGWSWWPLRQLQLAGLHPLWATGLIFLMAVLVLSLLKPQAWAQWWRQPALWAIAAAAGTTNACFNWAVADGDVVRVVLLFYLMPLWAVLLARWLLGEAISRAAMGQVALALAGAVCVLWPEDGARVGAPLKMADLLGLLGGFSFAMNNVLIRRSAASTEAAGRGLAMFLGGALVALALLPLVGAPALPPVQGMWPILALLLTACFLLSNMALQYSATRLPAQLTALLMLTEVPWAAFSSWWLGAGHLNTQTLLGGTLIASAALLSARR